MNNVQHIIRQYNQYQAVDELFVWNNNKDLTFSNSEFEKVKVINCSQDFGLNTRFTCSTLCRNNCIIVNDDDLVLSESNIENLIFNYTLDPQRIHTYEGRNILNGNYPTKNSGSWIEKVDIPTECDIALTRSSCFHKSYAIEYLKTCHLFFNDVDIVLNGEDIVFSLMTTNISNKRHLVLPILDIDGFVELPNQNAISTRANHFDRRSQLVARCIKYMNSKKMFL